MTQTRSVRQSFTQSPDLDSRGERESLHSTQLDRERGAARQRAAPTRRRETDEARATQTHGNVRVTTGASETEGVAAVSWIESLVIRRPFGWIDPTSIRETELHTAFRRRHIRGERESLHSPQLDRERDAARQRAAATRMVGYIHEPYPWAQSVVARR